MRIEDLIKNYFFKTEIEDWNYLDFNKYLKLLGYKNDEVIFGIYNEVLKEFVDYNHNSENTEQNNNDRRTILIELFKTIGKENYKVFHFFIITTFLKIQNNIILS